VVSVTINKNDAGQRLDKFLQKAFPSLPQSMMYKAIRQKDIKLNRKRCEISTRLSEGDVLDIYLPDDALTPAKAADDRPSFMRAGSPDVLMYVMFALAGIAWATINVNSFPMVVELCSGANVGKYTGFYYTASMAAQTITPMFSGLLMDNIADTVLFPYATVFVALAFVTMFFVKQGDAKQETALNA